MLIAIFLYLSYRKICQRILTLSGHILYANPLPITQACYLIHMKELNGLNKS